MFPLGISTIEYSTTSMCGVENCSFNIIVETSEETAEEEEE